MPNNVMRRTTHTHLFRGRSHGQTWCGKRAGFHVPLQVTADHAQATCPRCLKAAGYAR